MREFVIKSAILKQIWSKASQIALLETKIASPPPSFLVREAVPDCPSGRAIWDGCPSLPFQKGKLGRNCPRLPSRRAIWDGFGQRRAFWDAFGERPRVPSLTTDSVKVSLEVCDLEEARQYLIFTDNYNLIGESPGWFSSDYIEREIYANDADHLVRGCFYPWIKIESTHIFNAVLEAARFESEFNHPRVPDEESDEEEYNPPKQTYREDCCVICLESKPNILYLDCAHIAICDSCDRLKTSSRKNCDVCRTEISKTIKI